MEFMGNFGIPVAMGEPTLSHGSWTWYDLDDSGELQETSRCEPKIDDIGLGEPSEIVRDKGCDPMIEHQRWLSMCPHQNGYAGGRRQ